MEDSRLEKHWKVVEAMLGQAADFLHEHARRGSPRVRFEEYKKYLQANEFELAMEELENLGRKSDPRSGFWRRLKKVSDQMSLASKSDEYEREFHESLARPTRRRRR